jgi:hypothetical protein
VEAAASPETSDGSVTTAAPDAATTTLPAVPDSAPAPDTAPAATVDTQAPTATTAPAPAVQEAPPAPSSFTISGTVSNIPDGATVTVQFNGPGGSFSAIVDGSGHYAISGVPAGTYEGIWSWEAGGAAQAGRLGTMDINGDSDVSFALS